MSYVVFSPEDLRMLMMQCAGLGRTVTPRLINMVNERFAKEMEKTSHYGFAMVQRPVEGMHNVLVTADYAASEFMPGCNINSPTIVKDMAQSGKALVEQLCQHYNLTVKH